MFWPKIIMAITKIKKGEIFDKVSKIIDASKTLVFVNFKGLTVSDAIKIRKALKAQNVSYLVAKKTITRKALEKKAIEGSIPDMAGEVAIVYSDDALAPAREIYEFQKKLKNIIKIIGGVFESKYVSGAEMINIATIPNKNILIGMFANVINSPIQGLVISLSEIAKKKEVK